MRGAMVVRGSAAGFDETGKRLLDAIERRGLTVFAQIDHAAGAREAGLDLEDEVVTIFGNPRSGTPLMQADRRIGLELPLRMLVWREGADVHVGYADPHDLARDYDVTGHDATLEQMSGLLAELAAEAAGS
jgi:uncharacterized protein (DUF302 family)